VGVNVAAPAPGGAEAIADLGHEVYQIDTFMAGYDRISAGYLIRADRPCLVETGTAASAPVVRDALARLGTGPADLATVVVTHIHLDHACGIGDIAQMFPSAEVVVHERGAPHLADSELLMASAQMAWGDRLDELFGTLAPTSAERIRAVQQTGTIGLGGGRRLESHYAPGHATHHISLVDSLTGDLYVGDAAGVYIPATGDLRPATPPPDFDLQTALQSLRTFAALPPSRLLFSHYGRCRTSRRRWTGRPRRSTCGSTRPAGPRDSASSSTTRRPWSPSEPGKDTRSCATAPTPSWQ
jgi:glyoxylase-like metal-dependent hydrolase (beta-lactamase superfamily II)